MPVECPEADVAGLHRAEGARLVQRASAQRHGRAHRDCGECAARNAQGRRPAGSRRRTVDRRVGDGLRAPAGRRPAGAARCRSQRPYRRPRCRRRGRQSDRRSAVRAQACAVRPACSRCPIRRRIAPPARVHFKLEGPVPAAAELLRMDRLRDVADAPFDPSTMRGKVSAQVTLGMPLKPDLPPGSTNYAITVDATNFSADRMIMGQKVDAAMLRATATPQGFQLKGDVKIAGAPASLEYRKARGDPDAEVRIAGMLDEAARNNLGFDAGDAISGAIPIRLAGRVAIDVRSRGPLRRRGRSDAGADRWAAARLGKAGRQAGARDLHADHQAAIDPHRGSADRRRRRRRQGHDRLRRLRRSAIGAISRPTVFPTATAPTSRSTAPPMARCASSCAARSMTAAASSRAAAGAASSNAERQAPRRRRRPRYEARRRRRLQRRGVARRRSENVAPRRRDSQLRRSTPRSAATPR